jgi:hypothetical protein
MPETLDWVPLSLIFPLTLALILVSMELGFRFGRWQKRRRVDEREGPVGTMVGAMLALLGFILAFTFGLASNQFEHRREVIVAEANAIGTAYLRAGLIQEPFATNCKSLLREYVDVRERDIDQRRFSELLLDSERIQGLLWDQAEALARVDPHPVPAGMFIDSINEVIDQHSVRRLAGLKARVPGVVWLVLYGLTIVSMGAVGYTTGMAERSRSWASIGLAIAFSGVLQLVADVDRPGEGSLTSQRWAMRDLLHSMNQDLGASEPPRP